MGYTNPIDLTITFRCSKFSVNVHERIQHKHVYIFGNYGHLSHFE